MIMCGCGAGPGQLSPGAREDFWPVRFVASTAALRWVLALHGRVCSAWTALMPAVVSGIAVAACVFGRSLEVPHWSSVRHLVGYVGVVGVGGRRLGGLVLWPGVHQGTGVT
jgi:hypothetical protein